MEPETKQRQRVAIALLVTIIMVPLYLYLTNSDGAATTASDTTIAVSDPMGTIPTGYLSGPQNTVEEKPPTIAIPKTGSLVTTTATYDGKMSSSAICLVPPAPYNQQLTVTNTDNGRKVACKNSIRPEDYPTRLDPTEAVLHIDAFLAIADLTDAPVPVEVTW